MKENDVVWNDIFEALRELSLEMRALRELLAPELKKTAALQRRKEELQQIEDDAKKFLQKRKHS